MGGEVLASNRPPVLVIGKGPSARPVDASPDYHLAALNGASVLTSGRLDYLCVNDVEAFSEIPGSVFGRLGTIVSPTGLHVRGGRAVIPASFIRQWFHPWDFDVELYRLPSHRRLADTRWIPDVHDLPTFGRVHSVGESAVAWLLWRGYREFRTVGIDPQPGYSPEFEGGPQTAKPARWFRRNYERITQRVRDAGGSIRAA